MKTENIVHVEKLADLTHELQKIRALVGLCGFAAEALRTLSDIDTAAEINPELGKELDRRVDARNEWREHESNLGLVLKGIGYRLDGAIGLSDELESGYE